MYSDLDPSLSHDAEAIIRILRPDEGGRKSAAVNGIRWDMSYLTAGRLEHVHPRFEGFAANEQLPVDTPLKARLFVLFPEERPRNRWMMKPESSVYFREGGQVVAEGTITQVTGLSSRIAGEPQLQSYELPRSCEAFVAAGKQLEYDAAECECGRVRLATPDEIYCDTLTCDYELSCGIFRKSKWFRGHVLAVNLIAEAESYSPEFILCWLPALRLFATADIEHNQVTVFPGRSWEDIVGDPALYLSSQWLPPGPPFSVQLDARQLTGYREIDRR